MTAAVDFSVCVVLPASGTGERFGTDPPKQFNSLLGRPLILHTISAFHRLSWVKHIILPVNKGHKTYIQGLVVENDYSKVTVIEGCHTRHRSIFRGIQEIQKVCSKPDVVIIHDVVRIFAEEETIRDVALAAKTYGAAGVTRPLVSTVISSDREGFLLESLDRSQYSASEMPQAFLYPIVLKAYLKATEDDFDHGTECLLLALKYTGTRAKLIPGPSNLWKVTYRKDLYAAEGMLKEAEVRVFIKTMEKSLRELILTACRKKRLKICQDVENDNCLPNSYIISDRSCDFKDIFEKNGIINMCRLGSGIIPAVILVAFSNNLSAEDKVCFRNMCYDYGKKNKGDGIINGIILQNEESCQEEAAEMIASLLWNRDTTLTGQVFNIR